MIENSSRASAEPQAGGKPRRRIGALLLALGLLLVAVWWLDGVGIWLRSYAQRALMRGDPIAALGWIERATQKNANDHQAHLLSARALLQMNMPTAAREALLAAQESGASEEEWSAMQAVVAAQAGNMAAAEKLMNWSGAVQLPPEAYEAIIRAAQFNGQLSRAELILDQLEQAAQMPGVVLYHRGRIEEMRENYEAAAEWYARAAALPGSMPRCAFRAGICYYKSRDFERAESMFRQAARDPYRVISNIEVARCLWEQGKLSEAFDVIHPLLAFEPRQLQSFYLQVDEYCDTDRAALVAARIEDENGQAETVVTLLDRVLQHNPREFEARSLLIRNLKLLGRHEQAARVTELHSQMVAQRQRANQLRLDLLEHPKDVERMLELARLLWNTESDAEALLMIDDVLALAPDNPSANRLRAEILASTQIK
jgi:tetratricopeptide (TPR) repeat protein